jgi:amino acid transporter
MARESGTHALKKATFVQLAFMIYGASCGGAFGAEEMVSASGPGMALVTLMVVPLLFCFPVAVAVGELTAAFPVEGGNYRWSRMAYGDFWGFQAAWWTWMTGVATNVVFTQLFANYLAQWVPSLLDASTSPPGRTVAYWLVCVALIWLMHALNVRGIDVVGNVSIVLTVLLLVPFVAMGAIGLAGWKQSPFVPLVVPGQDWMTSFGASLSLAIFLYAGYDKLSNVADEVEDPQKNFPPALFIAIALAIASYVLPTMLAIAALGNWSEWKAAYFTTAAERLGGPWLAYAMTAAGLASNALLLNVTMLAVSRVPLALAEDGFLPGTLSRLHPVFRTPIRSLLWGSVTYCVVALLDFNRVLIINAWFQMASNLLVFANVWALRRKMPDAPRPFRIPMGRVGLVVSTVATSLLALLAIVTSVYSDGKLQVERLLIGLSTLASGIVIYEIIALLKRRAWKDVDPRHAARPPPPPGQ